MQINTNLFSLNAQRNTARSGEDMLVSMQRLSSGLRINSARDDAAGLAISSRMTASINGLRRAGQNINDGISLLQVADGAAGQLTANFQRMRELAVQAANDTNSRIDRAAIQLEADALAASNADIVDGARFNNLKLLDGSFAQQMQVGARAGDTIQLVLPAALVQQGYTQAIVNMAPQQASAVGGPVLAALKSGDLSINNTSIGASVAGALPSQGAKSAYAVAAAINAAGVGGISAGATTTVEAAVGALGPLPGASLAINGVDVGAISGATLAARVASAAAAINAVAGSTGVSAGITDDKLTLTAADGRDILLSESLTGAVDSLGLKLGTHTGAVTVTEAARPGTHTMRIAGANPGAAGLGAGKFTSVIVGPNDFQPRQVYSQGEPPLDLSTASGASDALEYLDAKIEQVSAIRTLLGANSNRLASAAGNAENTANNLSAARSRILDTDYAAETAQLTRTRILQQAGLSVLAQANTLPQQALMLLR
jgi:flagellin